MMPNSNNEGEQRTPQRVKLFTEVTTARAAEIERGVFESTTPPVHPPARWQAEWALDHFQPEDLRQKGITRRQDIFSSHLPYQGHQPIADKVLVEFEVDENSLYIAESEFVSNIITPAMSDTPFSKLMERKEIFDSLFPETGISRATFEERLATLSGEKRDSLLEMSKGAAEDYWKSVVPYSAYQDQGVSYEEPEALIVRGARFENVKRSGA